MKGIKFDYRISKVLLKKLGLGTKNLMIQYRTDWKVPEIEHPRQVLVKTSLGGICASDLHQLSIDMSYFASIFAAPTRLFPIGHEVVGELTDMGSEVTGFNKGDRVVFFPLPTCESYGFHLCESCKAGNLESCYSLVGMGDGSALEKQMKEKGGIGGFGGGGFSEYLVGFENQFLKVPDQIPDRVAVLAEPLAIAVHAAARHLPADNQTVVVIGAGIIGLLIIAALRGLGSSCRIVSIARYEFQADAAKGLGADEIISTRNQKQLYEEIAQKTGASLFKPLIGKKGVFGNRGPDMIFDSIATETTMDDALHLIRSNGKIVVVGLGYHVTKKIDWALQVFKEIDIVGSVFYGIEPQGDTTAHAFTLALSILKKNPDQFDELLTHQFPIDEYRTAFDSARHKSKNNAIKLAFRY